MALSESEIGLIGSRPKPELGASLDFASRRNPDDFAESQKLEIDDGVFSRNKDEVKRLDFLSNAKPDLMQESHPKTSNWLSSKDNAAVAIDDLDILKGMETESDKHDRSWGEFGTDTAIDVGKGVVGLGESVVGVADLLTFNAVGNALEYVGYDPEQTKHVLSGYYSKQRNRADKKVAKAKGFFDTLGAMAENPSSAFGTIVESTPMMLGIAASVRAMAGKMLAAEGIAVGTPEAAAFLAKKSVISKLTLASAGAEGAMAAGQIQETARQAGRGYTESVIPSILAGLGTAAIGKISSKILPDVEVSAIVQSMKGASRPKLIAAGKQIASGTIKEGVLEEMPQSSQEQVFTNLAMGKPWDEGVGEAAAMGLVAGTGMGGGMSVSTQTMALMSGKEKEIKTEIFSESEQQTLDQVISYAQTSTTNNRATMQFQDFINSLGAEREVLVPNDIAAEMVDAPDYITEQLNDLGTSVSIPMDKFGGEIAKNSEWMTLLRPHIKLSESALTQSEMGEETGEIDALLQKALNEKETLNEADKIFKTVKDQIVATGLQGEQTARQSAQLYPAAAAVMVEKAKKAGHDLSIDEAFEMMGFSVERGAVDVEVTDDVILDQPAIPDDLEIEMESEVIETGETVTESFNAKELSTEIDGKLDSYQRLRDCLA